MEAEDTPGNTLENLYTAPTESEDPEINRGLMKLEF